MPFTLNTRTDLSLLDLKRIEDQGGSCVRSPHVGNFYPNNLALAQFGFRMNCYERTFGRKDINYHPQYAICGGKSEVIANSDLLTTHVRVDHSSKLLNGNFPLGSRILDCHMKALRSAFPLGRFTTYTQYLKDHADLALDILRVLSCEPPCVSNDKKPWIWERVVDGMGNIGPKSAFSWEQALAGEIFGLTNDEEGLLVSNLVNVLFFGIFESLDYHTCEVYHLSGPDMVKYIGGMEEKLHLYYDHVRRELKLPLPENLVFNLVPVADMRFAVAQEQCSQLDELIDAYLVLCLHKKERAAAMKKITAPREKKSAVQRFNKESSGIHERLNEAVANCPGIFYDLRVASDRFTQHDICQGGKLYIHQWGAESPMADVIDAMSLFRRIGKKCKKLQW